ncbi:hypothetical protein [Viridibacillus arvi]|uniref:hypothetical protein n=1 Tax=Viridibacillus arvi TaxID=263475 RepID=UPI0034CD4D17
MTTSTHYKLPLDTEVDADIINWINKYHRTKKGEMVRHAIRYYMEILEDGESIKFPHKTQTTSASNSNVEIVADKPLTQKDQQRTERKKKRPVLNPTALK